MKLGDIIKVTGFAPVKGLSGSITNKPAKFGFIDYPDCENVIIEGDVWRIPETFLVLVENKVLINNNNLSWNDFTTLSFYS